MQTETPNDFLIARTNDARFSCFGPRLLDSNLFYKLIHHNLVGFLTIQMFACEFLAGGDSCVAAA